MSPPESDTCRTQPLRSSPEGSIGNSIDPHPTPQETSDPSQGGGLILDQGRLGGEGGDSDEDDWENGWAAGLKSITISAKSGGDGGTVAPATLSSHRGRGAVKFGNWESDSGGREWGERDGGREEEEEEENMWKRRREGRGGESPEGECTCAWRMTYGWVALVHVASLPSCNWLWMLTWMLMWMLTWMQMEGLVLNAQSHQPMWQDE